MNDYSKRYYDDKFKNRAFEDKLDRSSGKTSADFKEIIDTQLPNSNLKSTNYDHKHAHHHRKQGMSKFNLSSKPDFPDNLYDKLMSQMNYGGNVNTNQNIATSVAENTNAQGKPANATKASLPNLKNTTEPQTTTSSVKTTDSSTPSAINSAPLKVSSGAVNVNATSGSAVAALDTAANGTGDASSAKFAAVPSGFDWNGKPTSPGSTPPQGYGQFTSWFILGKGTDAGAGSSNNVSTHLVSVGIKKDGSTELLANSVDAAAVFNGDFSNNTGPNIAGAVNVNNGGANINVPDNYIVHGWTPRIDNPTQYAGIANFLVTDAPSESGVVATLGSDFWKTGVNSSSTTNGSGADNLGWGTSDTFQTGGHKVIAQILPFNGMSVQDFNSTFGSKIASTAGQYIS